MSCLLQVQHCDARQKGTRNSVHDPQTYTQVRHLRKVWGSRFRTLEKTPKLTPKVGIWGYGAPNVELDLETFTQVCLL